MNERVNEWMNETTGISKGEKTRSG